MRTIDIILLLVVICGCSSRTVVIKANSTPAIQANDALPADLLIDIGITPLDPGLEEGEVSDDEISIPEVRRAESRFVAYHLKNTLELTGNWGAVRVTPENSVVVDLLVTGALKVSDGERLKASIKAVDSTGRVWIDKDYTDISSKFSYRNQRREDPFQDFYNDIANDLLAFRQTLTTADLLKTRRTSSLRFAASFSPEAFSEYMERDRRGKLVITRLPADDDPMLKRINKIKEREYLFIDTIDIFYAKFYNDMQLPYHDWREYSYDEAVKLRQTRKEARNRMLGGAAMIVGGIIAAQKSGTRAGQTSGAVAVGAGAGVVKSGFTRRKTAEIHADALKELASSLGAEIAPLVMDIEGKTVELTGSVEQQYARWRELLIKIYAEETGAVTEEE